jgi:hypothetical protein
MIVVCREELIGILSRNTVYQNIVYSLQVERLFHLRVRRDEEMQQNKSRDEEVKRPHRERHIDNPKRRDVSAIRPKVVDWNRVDATNPR